MSHTHNQSNYWKLRKLAKEIGSMQQTAQAEGLTEAQLRANATYQDTITQFEVLWREYGNKSMVMDQRRRGSTRKANQFGEKVVARAAKRSAKAADLQSALAELTADEAELIDFSMD